VLACHLTLCPHDLRLLTRQAPLGFASFIITQALMLKRHRHPKTPSLCTREERDRLTIAFNRQNGDAFIPADAVHPSAVVRHRLYPVGSHQVMLPLRRNRHRSVQSAVDDLHRRADGRAPRKAQRRLLQRLADLGRGPTTSLFNTCPVGYSAASTETFWPYFRTTTNQVGGAPKTTTLAAKDVQASIIYCCPSAPGSGLHFGLDLPDDFRVNTVHDGITYSGYTYVMPRCRATATALSGQTVTLTPFSDTIGGERRRQESTPLITEIWDEAKKVYAEAESFVHTVFADGHTCYGTCDQYWSSQYTSPATATVGSKTGTSPAPTSGTCRVAQKTGWRRMRGFMLAAAVAATVLV